MKIKIDDRWIGEGHPCFVIAEAGINHNGKLEIAKKLIDAAKEVGADAVKFQTYKSENVTSRYVEMADYQKKNIGKEESQLEMIKKFELPYENFIELKEYCDKKQIMFLSTPHSYDAADFLEDLVPAYKIGSGDLTNLPFLEKIAEKKKPILLSTGMANLDEIKEAVDTIQERGCNNIILLHCITSYPTRVEDVNLKAIKTLEEVFNLPVGYSDHTLSITVPIAAVAMGACVIEKHFTLDRDMPGPDHKASLEPHELKKMIKEIREIEKALGDGVKKPTQDEEKIKKIVRKSIVAKVDIPKDSIITREMLEIKRPATGIPPKYLSQVVGARAKTNICKDEALQWEKVKVDGT